MTSSAQPERIGQRYRVQRRLGRGGMASVYEVADLSLGRVVALKQLSRIGDANKARQSELLFEREFHTLAELSHPRVIEVYDYGIEDGSPYYTMELLDGGDLRERVPLPWPEACALMYEVCSSLALLHSRRLVHRDVSPRNIRCTRDGAAKLIDFGAMAPMGQGRQPVGTPSFVAPEVLHRATLDGRTDLFSIGATLYHALTGRMAYPARDFEQLIDAWAHKPRPPSTLAEGVPLALDTLVMSLLSLDPASRPRSAVDVMDRLSAITGNDSEEPLSVQQAYLSTPMLVGREAPRTALHDAITRMVAGVGGCITLHGRSGVGRSRMLDACVLEAKMQSACVLHAAADNARPDPLAIAQLLAEQVLETHPQAARKSALAEGVRGVLFAGDDTPHEHARLKAFSDGSTPIDQLQIALTRWLLRIAADRPIVIAVDDVERIDEASAGLLVLLADQARSRKLLLALTHETDHAGTDSQAVSVLLNRSAAVELRPLYRSEEAELLGSVFGDVPNLGFVCSWIHEIAHGNPRLCMEVAQHLVDRQWATYHGGSWTLPGDGVAIELPSSIEEVWRQRIAGLSPLARTLAQTHAFALDDALTRDQYIELAAPEHDPKQVDRALDELTSLQIMVDSGDHHSLAHRGFRANLSAQLSASEKAQRHQALARLYAAGDELPLAMRAAHHLIEAGEPRRAAARILPLLPNITQELLPSVTNLSSAQLVHVLESSLDAASKSGGSPLELAILRRRLMTVAAVIGPAVYYRHAADWLAQLEHDSGLRDYRELNDIADPAQRLGEAFMRASSRYNTAPEPARGYRPDEAIRLLVYYVSASIHAGVNAFDHRLLASLARVLEPFVAISPLIAIMRNNAIASHAALGSCRFDQARELWTQSCEQLDRPEVAALEHVPQIRSAVAYGVGALDARLGLLGAATKWADFLAPDPYQRYNVFNLRRMISLQQGDWDGAERWRKQAEVVAAQNNLQVVFNGLTVELAVVALCDDLTTLRQTMTKIAKLAAVWPGWVQFDLLAQGHFHRSCGEYQAALDALSRALLVVGPSEQDPEHPITAGWPAVTAAYIETLIDLSRYEDAEARGQCALATCKDLGLHLASAQIARALALAEAKLGDYTTAAERLETTGKQQADSGVSGLQLGATYEARTRVAIWAGDKHAMEVFGALTAREYRHGHGSALGARYDRLMDEARRAGVEVLPDLSAFTSTLMPSTHSGSRPTPATLVERVLHDAETKEERAQYALTLLCEKFGARAGYLYLCAPTGLRFAASHAAGPTDEEALKLVRAELARELADNERATRMMSDVSGLQTEVELSWTNASGIVFRPLLLTCSVEGKLRHAGVAALAIPSARDHRRELKTIATAVAACLIAAGDTAGLTDDS